MSIELFNSCCELGDVDGLRNLLSKVDINTIDKVRREERSVETHDLPILLACHSTYGV